MSLVSVFIYFAGIKYMISMIITDKLSLLNANIKKDSVIFLGSQDKNYIAQESVAGKTAHLYFFPNLWVRVLQPYPTQWRG